MLCFANVTLFIYFLWPPYAPAHVDGGSRNFYTWWTMSVNEEVTTWMFSWSFLNYTVGQKVTKFGILSDPILIRYMAARPRANATTLRDLHDTSLGSGHISYHVCVYMDVHASGSRSLPCAATLSSTY